MPIRNKRRKCGSLGISIRNTPTSIVNNKNLAVLTLQGSLRVLRRCGAGIIRELECPGNRVLFGALVPNSMDFRDGMIMSDVRGRDYRVLRRLE